MIPSEDVASRLPVSRPVVVWRCGSQMRRHSRWVESTTAFRVLKKTLEVPYSLHYQTELSHYPEPSPKVANNKN